MHNTTGCDTQDRVEERLRVLVPVRLVLVPQKVRTFFVLAEQGMGDPFPGSRSRQKYVWISPSRPELSHDSHATSPSSLVFKKFQGPRVEKLEVSLGEGKGVTRQQLTCSDRSRTMTFCLGVSRRVIDSFFIFIFIFIFSILLV